MLLQASGLCLCFHLTLTRVVFESYKDGSQNGVCLNLTLTRVVFEFYMYDAGLVLLEFNFNKSCI